MSCVLLSFGSEVKVNAIEAFLSKSIHIPSRRSWIVVPSKQSVSRIPSTWLVICLDHRISVSPECAEACGYVLPLVLHISISFFPFLELCVSSTKDFLVLHAELEQPKFSAESTARSSNWLTSIYHAPSQLWKYVGHILNRRLPSHVWILLPGSRC